MRLIARHFEVYPEDSALAASLGPLFASVSGFSFPFQVGKRNNNQVTSGFDQALKASLKAHGAGEANDLPLPKEQKKALDFLFT